MVKDISKKQKRYKWIIIPIVLYAFLIIGIIGVLIYAYNTQYNLRGISNILSIYIDKEREREYVGTLDGHEIYVEQLRAEELCYRTFRNKTVSLKEAVDNKLVSIKDWRRGAWYIFKDNDAEILRYESYEIACAYDVCIIRPISEFKSVDINCNNFDRYRITLKKGNAFDCDLLGKNYHFKIKDIYNDYIIVTVSDYGLAKVQDEGTDLKSKEKEFVIEKNKEVELTTQNMDSNESLIIECY